MTHGSEDQGRPNLGERMEAGGTFRDFLGSLFRERTSPAALRRRATNLRSVSWKESTEDRSSGPVTRSTFLDEQSVRHEFELSELISLHVAYGQFFPEDMDRAGSDQTRQ